MEITGLSVRAAPVRSSSVRRSSSSSLDVKKSVSKGKSRSHDEEKLREEEKVSDESKIGVPKAIRVRRAKAWDSMVEENFRLQTAGWKDIHEYRTVYGEPERWPENGFVKCLRVKKSGFYSYWRPHREMEDKFVNQVKMYEYA